MKTNSRLLLQLPLALLILAFVPTNVGKLVAFVIMWTLTFGPLSKAEAILYAAVCLFFTGMNAASLKQGIFTFAHPDLLRMPVYELFMWGFYLLHTLRLLKGPRPMGSKGAAWALALAYAASFAVLKDGDTLLLVTGTLLAIGLALFHERHDLMYTGYLILFGAAIEYTGVASGEWFYPGSPPGGVPLWFITLWGGVGLFLRRLILPLMIGGSAPAPAPAPHQPG